MSRAADLVHALRARGVVLEIQGGRLRFKPRRAITAQELEVLKEHKAEVLALLSGASEGNAVAPAPKSARHLPLSKRPGACTCPRETWKQVRVDPSFGCLCGLGWICRVCGGCRGCFSHGPGASKAPLTSLASSL